MHLIFAVESNGLWGIVGGKGADQLGEGRNIEEMGGARMKSFLDGEQSLGCFGLEGLECERAWVIISFSCEH